MNTATAAAEFRLDAQYRRSCIYIAVSFTLIGMLAIWLDRAVMGRDWPQVASRAIVCAGIVALSLVPMSWRMRVEEHAIWRRRLCSWDRWPWDDFIGGHLHYGFDDHSFVDARRPWWRRKLTLEYLSDADRQQVWRWIRLVWEPPQPPLPSEIELRYGVLSSTVRFDARGIHVGKNNRARSYPWSDVTLLEVDGLRHDRDDFRRLSLRLPDRRIGLHVTSQHGFVSRSWKGPGAETVARLLRFHVPVDRQLICASLDVPRTLREAESRLAKANKNVRDVRITRAIYRTIAGGGMVWLVAQGEVKIAASFFVTAVIYESVVRFLWRRVTSDQKQLLRWHTELSCDRPLARGLDASTDRM